MNIKSIIKNILFKVLSGNKNHADLRVLSGQAKGVKLRIDIRKEGSYFLGTYDKWILDRIDLSKYIKPGMIAWDCGAYIGYYSALFRRCVGTSGEVFAFEASSTNYKIVKEVPRLNKWTNVKVINIAVGLENSVIRFSDNLNGSNGPVGMDKTFDKNVDVIEVECRGVDEIIAMGLAKTPDFIKFDLETAEIYALKNGDQLFSIKKPILLLEIHGEASYEAAGKFLKKYHYKAANVYDFPEPKTWYKDYNELLTLDHIPHMLMCKYNEEEN
ncbi:FkbM family methyltransferase [Pedobacter sp. Du54]|uniref:FkbM family methyltransferase n=1 Tax=Pedobacter anseongensis TaxID=3133439 RepID=UPI0030992F4F